MNFCDQEGSWVGNDSYIRTASQAARVRYLPVSAWLNRKALTLRIQEIECISPTPQGCLKSQR